MHVPAGLDPLGLPDSPLPRIDHAFEGHSLVNFAMIFPSRAPARHRQFRHLPRACSPPAPWLHGHGRPLQADREAKAAERPLARPRPAIHIRDSGRPGRGGVNPRAIDCAID